MSRTIFEGTVMGYRAGFYRTVPGFLLNVRIDSILVHDAETTAPAGGLLVFYPGPGTFTMLDRTVCPQSYMFPRVPSPGDRVLILSGRSPLDMERGTPLELYNQNIIIERRVDRSVELTFKLRQDARLAAAQDLSQIRSDVMQRRSAQ